MSLTHLHTHRESAQCAEEDEILYYIMCHLLTYILHYIHRESAQCAEEDEILYCIMCHLLTYILHYIHRESAQCAEEDEKDFQNTDKHKYFNTNNLWIRLDKLKEVLDSNDGIVPLPMIKNSKTVEDPADDASLIYTHTCVCVCVSVCLHYIYIYMYIYTSTDR